MLFNHVLDAVGNTPLIQLQHQPADSAAIYVKLEKNNPSGSIKDRAVKYILQDLLASGELQPGGTIVEPTSGNTGVGLAMAGAALGLKVIIVMPDSMSIERRQLMQAYGAELVLTPASEGGMKAAKAKAEELAQTIEGAVLLGQFSNQANVRAHAEGTAREILADLGQVDAFVAGVGTSGTIVGTAQTLKAANPDVKIVAVEPADSPLLKEGHAGSHKIQGIGANFVPEIYNNEQIDAIELVTNDEAIAGMRELARTQGLLVGISSGANYVVAKRIAAQLGAGKHVVTVLPDTGERYLSTGVLADDN